MCGYNSSIFCYGQTGSGKTHTMLGRLASKPAAEEPEPLRGLAPRAFEYLFQRIAEEEAKKQENVTYCCRCSMIEIYNECITDLLNPAATNLQVREDIRHGCFVEHLTEVTVNNVTEVLALMKKGADNRHVGATRLNHESSRSHSVFTCVVERVQRESADSPTQVIFSRLNLVDLAGSERIQTGAHGGSQATGEHFKEACHINKSLTTLGESMRHARVLAVKRPCQGDLS